MSVVSLIPLFVLFVLGLMLLAEPAVELKWAWPPWNVTPFPGLSLQATGLVALADLKTLLVFTAYHAGGSSFQSMWILPGLQVLQNAAAIHQGEKPRVASLRTGRISRVENPATIFYLHRVSMMGKLVNVEVLPESLHPARKRGRYCWREFIHAFTNGLAAGPTMTIMAAIVLLISRDWWGLTVLSLLFAVRLSNTIMIKRRVTEAWMGALDEEFEHDGEEDDVIIFITVSRWIRMRGAAADINAVTEGKWLRDMRPTEDFADAVNKVMVYIAVVLNANTTQLGGLVIVVLLMLSAAAMGLLNVERREEFGMHGRKVVIGDPARAYESRRDMVKEIVEETGGDLWAMELGVLRNVGKNGAQVSIPV